MRFVVGRIGKPHGVRGEVTVQPRTDDPQRRFAEGATLLVAGQERTLEILRSAWHSGRLLVHFAGTDTRDAALALRGLVLEVERDPGEVPVDPEEYYDSSLIGCQAWLADGTLVGEVAEVVHLPAQDLLVIRDDDGREVLVPFVRQIVPLVDLGARRIELDPPDGLLDPTR